MGADTEMKIPEQSKPGAGFTVRTAARIAGVPGGSLGFGGGRNALGGAAALGAAQKHCPNGVYFRDDKGLNVEDSIGIVFRNDWTKVAMVAAAWRAGRLSASQETALVDRANSMLCGHWATAQSQASLDKQAAVNAQIAAGSAGSGSSGETTEYVDDTQGRYIPPDDGQIIDVGPGTGSEVEVTSSTPLTLPSPETPVAAFTFSDGEGAGIQIGDYQVPWVWIVAGAGFAWLAFKKR